MAKLAFSWTCCLVPDALTLAAAVAIAIGLGSLIPIWRWQERKLRAELAARGETAQGVLLKWGMGEDGWAISYAFIPKGKTVPVHCFEVLPNVPRTELMNGLPIMVRYLPDRPEQARAIVP
jgi:hypothetical protein